jgi:uncharacterized protein (DUF924 family)
MSAFGRTARLNAADHSTDGNAEPAWVTEVLHFWFDEMGTEHWFTGSEVIDAQILERFLSLHERTVAADGLSDGGRRSLLAAVIVLDQFSRHLFRGTPRAYAADSIARRLCRVAIARGADLGMKEHERYFLYLPLEHSEDPQDQALAVGLIEPLGNEEWTRDAIAHKVVIDRFGRFPHRNAILQRPSSADELALLQQPEEWF